MNESFSDLARADFLYKSREAQNIGVHELAKRVNLSPAQIHQLESGTLAPGQRSLFYTPAIEQKAAIKCAHALGVDIQTLWSGSEKAAAPHATFLPDLKILDDLVVLLKKQSMAQEMGESDRRISWKWLFIALVGLWMAGAMGFYGQQVLEWSQERHGQNAAPLSLAHALAPTESTQASAQPEPTVDMLFAAVAETPAASVVSQADALCDSPSPQSTMRASQASKAGNSVHVVAIADLVMCVRDGLGKQTALTLKAQESRTLLGQAPWSVRVDKPLPTKLHMYFQGQKIYWPEGELSGVILKEVAGDF
jgi:transcriptional regulator with XRE-family HTH domain